MLREVITKANQFVEAAKKEGIQVSEKEAEVILGYMEGHDYLMGLDETGGVIRGDLAYKAGEEHWEEYRAWDAILFACDMCKDLLENPDGSDERMALIQEDNEILVSLYNAVIKQRGDAG